MSFAVISPSEPVLMPATGDGALQRASGAVWVGFRLAGGTTRLTRLEQRSPCRVLLPRSEPGDPPEAVFLNTAGGIAGGDRLEMGLSLGPGATARGTAQAAEKVYRALDRDAALSLRLEVGQEALLEWLPQETILFEGARLDRRLELDLAAGGRALLCDGLVFGRGASGEVLTRGRLRDRWFVRREGRLLWADALTLEGDLAALLRRPALLDGAGALGTLLFVGAEAAGLLPRARTLAADCGCRAGATLLGELLLCRFLAESGAALRRALVSFLTGFRPAIAGLAPALPRVWAC